MTITALFKRVGRSWSDERGEVGVVEMLMWLPVVVVLLGTMGVALRQNTTAGLTQDAAEAAARQARTGIGPAEGLQLAEASLAQSFARHPGNCNGTVDVTGWPEGTVTVTVTCDTDFTGLSYLNPGTYRVTRTWTETVDAARITRTEP